MEPSEKQCNCELYYSDLAIRERCLKMVMDYRTPRIEMCFYENEVYVANLLFKYVTTGDVPQEKQ